MTNSIMSMSTRLPGLSLKARWASLEVLRVSTRSFPKLTSPLSVGASIRSKVFRRYFFGILAKSPQEIYRVLQPAGIVEVVEDGAGPFVITYTLEFNPAFTDIIFPTLPRWYTNALRVRPLRDRFYSHGSEFSTKDDPLLETSSTISSNLPLHDHALLESLHTAVYSNRFINMKPLCMWYLCLMLFWLSWNSCSHFAELFDNIFSTSLLGTHHKFLYATISSKTTVTSTTDGLFVRNKIYSALPS